MTTDGKLYPLIPFDLVIDTEVGLLQTINKKYHNTDTFYDSLLNAPIKYQIYLLNMRKRINPITAIAKERDDEELMNDYYRQFMEEEYVDILKNSIITRMFIVIMEGIKMGTILPTIVCNSSLEKNYLLKRDKEVFDKCNIEVGIPFHKLIDELKDPIYIKDIMMLVPLVDKLRTKNVYIPRYRFNYEDVEKTTILQAPFIVASGLMKIDTFDLYNEEDMIIGK